MASHYFGRSQRVRIFGPTLFQNLGAALVVDLECGSGEAAKAAMESSIYYIGFAKDSHHQSWVSNNVDREALRQITKQGQMLFNATLAESISEIFKNRAGEGKDWGGAVGKVSSGQTMLLQGKKLEPFKSAKHCRVRKFCVGSLVPKVLGHGGLSLDVIRFLASR